MQGDAATLAQALITTGPQPNPLALPEADIDLEEAYAIQRMAHAQCALPVMVWKLGLTAEGPRTALHASEPAVGRLAASSIYSDGSAIGFSQPEMYAEAELIFEMADDLPPQDAPYTPETVLPAVKALYAGIEICSTRFVEAELPLGWLIADNVLAHGLVLGKKLAAGWSDKLANCRVTLGRNGEEPAVGSTAKVMDNPLNALVWLANWLCANGEGGLKREQLVASGSCTGVTQIFAGDTIEASFDGLVAARVSLLT